MGVGVVVGKVKGGSVELKSKWNSTMSLLSQVSSPSTSPKADANKQKNGNFHLSADHLQEDSPAWLRLLATTSVSDLLKEDKEFHLITVHEDDSLVTVMEVLHRYNISSAPVRSYQNDSEFIGIVDVEDLVTYCCAQFSPTFLTPSVAQSQMEQFLDKTTKQVVEISGRNWWQEISSSSNLLELLTLLCHPNVHRVAVLDKSKKLCGIVTQSMFVSFINKHRAEFGDEMLSSSLIETGLVRTEKREPVKINLKSSTSSLCSPYVEAIGMDENLICAFRLIWEREVSGVAVIDNEGTLVGNISASDLEYTDFKNKGEMISQLYKPIKDFLQINAVDGDVVDSNSPNQLFKVHQECTIGNLLELLGTKRAHRVFVVDEDIKPVDVVALSDLLRMLKLATEIKIYSASSS